MQLQSTVQFFRDTLRCIQVSCDWSHAFRLLPNRLLNDIDVRAVFRHLAVVLDVSEWCAPARVTLLGLRIQLTL